MLARLQLILMTAVFSLLVSCASFAPAPSQADRTWQGRFALTVTQADNGIQNNAGKFVLTRAARTLHLSLTSNFGTTLAVLNSGPEGASLVTADGKRTEAADAEELSEQLLGWRIPVDKLPGWLDGQALGRATQSGATPVTATGLGSGQGSVSDAGTSVAASASAPQIVHDGPWTIRYEAWNQGRPRRLQIDYPDRVVLRLVLQDD